MVSVEKRREQVRIKLIEAVSCHVPVVWGGVHCFPLYRIIYHIDQLCLYVSGERKPRLKKVS